MSTFPFLYIPDTNYVTSFPVISDNMDASRVQPIKLARVRKQLRLTNKSVVFAYTAAVMCIV